MQIECILKEYEGREEPFTVTISNQEYVFSRDPKGRYVATVGLDSHIQAFLARADCYQPSPDQDGVEPAIEEDDGSQAKRLAQMRRREKAA